MAGGSWALESGGAVRIDVKRRRRSHRPLGACLPLVDSGRIGKSRRRLGVGRTLQIMVEERLYPFHAPLVGGVAREDDIAEIVAIVIGARVAPGADGEVQQATALIFVLERLVDRRPAV